jgi:hypothetical protein
MDGGSDWEQRFNLCMLKSDHIFNHYARQYMTIRDRMTGGREQTMHENKERMQACESRAYDVLSKEELEAGV